MRALISYAPREREFAENLASDLRARGIEIVESTADSNPFSDSEDFDLLRSKRMRLDLEYSAFAEAQMREYKIVTLSMALLFLVASAIAIPLASALIFSASVGNAISIAAATCSFAIGASYYTVSKVMRRAFPTTGATDSVGEVNLAR